MLQHHSMIHCRGDISSKQGEKADNFHHLKFREPKLTRCNENSTLSVWYSFWFRSSSCTVTELFLIDIWKFLNVFAVSWKSRGWQLSCCGSMHFPTFHWKLFSKETQHAVFACMPAIERERNKVGQYLHSFIFSGFISGNNKTSFGCFSYLRILQPLYFLLKSELPI